MLLVGHADPRGDEEYNYVLGQRRADEVRRALGSLGLASERVSTSSRGEMDAAGTSEETWRGDRKVEVRLGG
jgi:peptidoglycan-associated lipoprotein